MVTVTTKEALKKAINDQEDKILIQGELARKIIKQKKIKKWTLISSISLAGTGLVLAPFTGGSSLGLTVHGLTVATASGTAISASVAEVAIIMGFLGITISIALLKGYTIKINKDVVIMEKNNKK